MLNRADIMGRLVDTPELRVSESGVKVTSFTVAVERNKKNEDGTKTADFIDCVSFGQTAEFVCKYFHKGDMIAVDAKIQTRRFTDEHGKSHKMTELITDNVSFCGGKKTETQNVEDAQEEMKKSDGDLPF